MIVFRPIQPKQELTMATSKSPTPDGYNTVMPYLRVRNALQAVEFYKKAFGAKKRMLLTMGDKVGHAEVEIGGCVIMLSDEFPEMGIVGPQTLRGVSCMLTVYVANVDKAVVKAEAAGATVKIAPRDEFYGSRMAQIVDPFGHIWSLQAHIEHVSPREMQKRLNKMMAAAD
jgi:PhnB protein